MSKNADKSPRTPSRQISQLDFGRPLPTPPTSSTIYRNPETRDSSVSAPTQFEISKRKRYRNSDQDPADFHLNQDEIKELIVIEDVEEETTRNNELMSLKTSRSKSVDSDDIPQSSNRISIEQFSDFLEYVKDLEESNSKKDGRIKSMEKTISWLRGRLSQLEKQASSPCSRCGKK